MEVVGEGLKAHFQGFLKIMLGLSFHSFNVLEVVGGFELNTPRKIFPPPL